MMDFACCGLPTPFTDTIGSPENQLALVGPFRALQIIFVIGAPLFRLTPLFGVTLFGVLPPQTFRPGSLFATQFGRVGACQGVLQRAAARAHGVLVKTPKSKAGRRDITLPDIVVETLREHRRRQLKWRMRVGLGKVSEENDLL